MLGRDRSSYLIWYCVIVMREKLVETERFSHYYDILVCVALDLSNLQERGDDAIMILPDMYACFKANRHAPYACRGWPFDQHDVPSC